ncbi:unnamed protein product [Pleuronectes platessa]|uniref:Uncharacterized protein n=1 Tax=Pleuronectes platessa TaxID=8262 RepID=A0A9N7V1T3_PLEPL|nr:unnamed protein product [Pleuronectes platessa]
MQLKWQVAASSSSGYDNRKEMCGVTGSGVYIRRRRASVPGEDEPLLLEDLTIPTDKLESRSSSLSVVDGELNGCRQTLVEPQIQRASHEPPCSLLAAHTLQPQVALDSGTLSVAVANDSVSRGGGCVITFARPGNPPHHHHHLLNLKRPRGRESELVFSWLSSCCSDQRRRCEPLPVVRPLCEAPDRQDCGTWETGRDSRQGCDGEAADGAIRGAVRGLEVGHQLPGPPLPAPSCRPRHSRGGALNPLGDVQEHLTCQQGARRGFHLNTGPVTKGKVHRDRKQKGTGTQGQSQSVHLCTYTNGGGDSVSERKGRDGATSAVPLFAKTAAEKGTLGTPDEAIQSLRPRTDNEDHV